MCLIPHSLVSSRCDKAYGGVALRASDFRGRDNGLTEPDDYRGQHHKTARWHHVNVQSDEAKYAAN
jgi:hypothetical protein